MPERYIEALLNKMKLPKFGTLTFQEWRHVDFEAAINSEHAKPLMWKIIRGVIVRIGGRFCPCQFLRPNMRWTPRLWRWGWRSGQLGKRVGSRRRSWRIGATSIVPT